MDTFDKISKYLDGLMDDDERRAFEKELENDPLLAKDIKRVKDLRKIYGSENLDELGRNIDEISPGRDKDGDEQIN
jgi:anti-sigma factor RsiW